MKTILFLKETILRYQFRCNYLRNKKTFAQFFVAFLKSKLNFKYFRKKDDLIDFVFPKLIIPKT